MAASFQPGGFDPVLITAQIVAMQTLLYVSLGMWLLLLTALSGGDLSEISLDLVFSYSSVSLFLTGGWRLMAAFFLNAIAGACFLCIVVERAKKCLDFSTTAHFLHLCFCYFYAGLPSNWEWWVLNGVTLALMALLGEFLCMRRELQDIPLFRGAVSQDSLLGLHRKSSS
mmetsp:Transcript_52779/g.121172  ORF Transcript_52779/g.121172 Transcript_52779/m.121172 type:complete len:170 (-) Transcript_52779:256-765(-)|eukprot:CAMPEP_0119377476 /NCGR_PEP_ID=MMETSP1334-20130426/45131_1 /TAXON_ID=127549 /ORGANISM="Calcidiscus leptoporus, Strain RCC1130" /LENGTH=169 /DNA_ID=CAMNT_0007396417 /DNA_START=41 /DNA_END=550 /DNA_ORIENTATION=+